MSDVRAANGNVENAHGIIAVFLHFARKQKGKTRRFERGGFIVGRVPFNFGERLAVLLLKSEKARAVIRAFCVGKIRKPESGVFELFRRFVAIGKIFKFQFEVGLPRSEPHVAENHVADCFLFHAVRIKNQAISR